MTLIKSNTWIPAHRRDSTLSIQSSARLSIYHYFPFLPSSVWTCLISNTANEMWCIEIDTTAQDQMRFCFEALCYVFLARGIRSALTGKPESQTTSDEMWREGEWENKQQRERASDRKERKRGRNRSVGVFIGVMRGEINKRGEKSLLVLRAPSPRQLKGPSKSRSNQRLNKDRRRRRFGWPRSCNLTPTALHSVAPCTRCVCLCILVCLCVFPPLAHMLAYRVPGRVSDSLYVVNRLLKGRLASLSFLSASFSVSLSRLWPLSKPKWDKADMYAQRIYCSYSEAVYPLYPWPFRLPAVLSAAP